MDNHSHAHEHAHEKDYVAETDGQALQGLAKYYDLIVSVISLGREKKLREATLDVVEISPGSEILEVGCGTGSLAVAAKRRQGDTGRVVGIDPSGGMIHSAHAKAHKAGLEVDFQVGVIEKLDFEDNSFDVVLSSLMMHHLPGEDLKRAAIAEVLRVLKPGGTFLIVDMDPTSFSLVTMVHGGVSKDSPQLKNKHFMQAAGYTQTLAGKLKFGKFYTLTGKKPI